MEVQYAARKSPLLGACQVAPEIFEQVLPRLDAFMQPFVRIFQGQAADQHAKTYVSGLLSNVERKNVASIASRFGQSRLPLQDCIGCDAWDDAPLRQALQGHIRRHVGQGDGVLVCDPSGFPTSGRESVGVARQWCGRLGKVDHCQVAISVGSVSRKGHTLVGTRLYLPKDWTKETARLDKAGVPTASRAYRTRYQVVVKMLAAHSAALPHRWIVGDDAMGRPSWFRRRLAALHARYLLAVPSHTAIRDLETPLPAYEGKGRRPTRPWHSVQAWSHAVDASAWQRMDVRDGAKGPLVMDSIKRRAVSRTHRRQQGDEALLTVIRSRARDQENVVKVDDSLSNADPETPLWEVARVTKAEHRMEACLHRGTSEAGLADDAVRHWRGWQQQQTLSLLATWFLVRETARGKKWTPAITLPQIRQGIARIAYEALQCGTVAHMLQEIRKRLRRNELARFYHHKRLHLLAPLNVAKRQF